ncbi:TPA: hypothetical protein LA742_002316 [Clostridium botulinum]|uniref:Uncharacterized protein n=3 Tax=Clostridium TaxID=1485 RepID=A0A1J1CZ88_CLOSG|nr:MULTISPECIES: hypothetical protein [Clostridium]MBE6076753.1 hypothetical protein [Clostridium lundense]APF27869.1 hypothetical protein NPD7_1963 [Clostridium sporogenes]AUM94969.1 hypothetical protein RSJ11_07360 [Clostridium sporogenes]AVQ40281.1 hypothetical protein C7M56_16940 [Clostridium botulinum]AVQ52408.1 hypothetical protein C7M59_05900 [Clostridium botulinum]
MSSLKLISSFLITIMLLIPFTNKCLNENKIVKNKSNLVLIEEKEDGSNKIKKRVKLRPEKEVNNIYINKI